MNSSFVPPSISVDVDRLGLYGEIHGCSQRMKPEDDPVWTRGVPRFLELLEDLGIRASFFLVGDDLHPHRVGGLVARKRRELVREIVARGHEVGSHSQAHDYRLSRRDRDTIERDLVSARAILEECGASVDGFRAPGYCLSTKLIEAAKTTGALYSSSRLPSAAYFGAKYMAMMLGLLRCRTSASIMGDVRAPLTSCTPYEHPCGLLELPIGVVTGLRIPLVGTLLTLFGEQGVRWLLPRVARRPWVHLEFHATDLLDRDDIPSAYRGLPQPDLAQSVTCKRSVFEHWLTGLGAHLASSRLVDLAHAMRADRMLEPGVKTRVGAVALP